MNNSWLAIACSLFGAVLATVCTVAFLGAQTLNKPEQTISSVTRADYVDLLLTLVTILLAAVGLTVTIGALVIGLVAFKTLREIKDEASRSAEDAAAKEISESIQNKLPRSLVEKLDEILPNALKQALLDEQTGHKMFTEMAKNGVLDDVMERAVSRLQYGEQDIENDPNQDEDQ